MSSAQLDTLRPPTGITWPSGGSTRRPRRWPLHPPPAELESLSSWLTRLAGLYTMPVKDLLGEHNLNLGGALVPANLDHSVPEILLAELAERTGTEVARLREMTLAGWAPWLFDDLYLHHREQEVFDTYVRANSVLLAPGEAGASVLSYLRSWSGPWQARPRLRACPICAAEHQRSALVWQLPLVLGCGEHRCYLENTGEVQGAVAIGKPVRARPVPEPLATLEQYTYTALLTGRVELPGREVHAGVWFRLLRSLLDEVSLAPSYRAAWNWTT